MPAKVRAAKERRPLFSAEVLQLFLELEHMGPRQNTEAFKAGSKRLAGLLNLSSEWWATCDVHDRSARPCWPPGNYAYGAWHRCRAMRRQLLAAVG
jgi:hypothetical protein